MIVHTIVPNTIDLRGSVAGKNKLRVESHIHTHINFSPAHLEFGIPDMQFLGTLVFEFNIVRFICSRQIIWGVFSISGLQSKFYFSKILNYGNPEPYQCLWNHVINFSPSKEF